MSLPDKSFGDLLSAFASPDPTPGGGSASAAASAIGASLLLMVASMPKTRSGSEDERAALAAVAQTLNRLRRELTEAVDADATAYDAVLASYRRPTASAAEQADRRAAIQRAFRGATAVPLRVIRLATESLKQAEAIAAHGHRAAATDIGVAVKLLGAGLSGARLNVDVNLEQLTDRGFTAGVKAEVDRLMREAEQSIEKAESLLGRR